MEDERLPERKIERTEGGSAFQRERNWLTKRIGQDTCLLVLDSNPIYLLFPLFFFLCFHFLTFSVVLSYFLFIAFFLPIFLLIFSSSTLSSHPLLLPIFSWFLIIMFLLLVYVNSVFCSSSLLSILILANLFPTRYAIQYNCNLLVPSLQKFRSAYWSEAIVPPAAFFLQLRHDIHPPSPIPSSVPLNLSIISLPSSSILSSNSSACSFALSRHHSSSLFSFYRCQFSCSSRVLLILSSFSLSRSTSFRPWAHFHYSSSSLPSQ